MWNAKPLPIRQYSLIHSTSPHHRQALVLGVL
jgi:hypothetical protein